MSDLEHIVLEPADFIVVELPPQVIDLSPLGSTRYQEFEEEVIRLTNLERTERGLHALVRNEQLSQSALAQALDMAENHFISHTGSDGSQVSHRVTRANYQYWLLVGENLAMGQRTPAEAVSGWMLSPGHRANLLHERFQEIGVAYIQGDIVTPDGHLFRSGYWVQNFGTRLSKDQIGPLAAKAWSEATSRLSHDDPELEIVIIDEHRDTSSSERSG